jgi:ribosome-associated toxin RatA of RatAB toxin-antitoxin module
MRSRVAIDIAASPDVVFGLAHRVDRWDRLLPHYTRSRVVSIGPDDARVVEFAAVRQVVPWVGLGLPVAWRARTWNEPETHRLRFLHVAGPTAGMDVIWRIDPIPAGCRVTIEHDFRPRVPGFAAFVDRWFTRPIAGRTLATFKALAETVAAEAAPSRAGPRPASAESDSVRTTNQPA